MLALEGQVGGVARGKNGRLFLSHQEAFDIDLFTSGQPFRADELLLWKRSLQRRAAELRRRGIPYVFSIVPDAHSVYPEELPDGVRSDFATPGEKFLEAMKDVEGVTFVYPLAELRAAKRGADSKLDPYRANDTHWSQYGSLIGYRALCAALPQNLGFTEIGAEAVAFDLRRMFGDLGSMVEPEQVAWSPVATIRGHETSWVYDNDGVSRINVIETVSPTARGGRAMFFRDSFMTDQAPYVMRSFAHVLLAGTTTRLHLDEVDRWRPDIVVSQVGERRLFAYESDHGAEMFDDLYRTDYRSPLGRQLLVGMLHLARGDTQQAWDCLMALDAAALDAPGHLFAAARIAFAHGDIVQAAGFIAQARARRPDQASYLCLAAQVAFRQGDHERAVAITRRATEVAPYNGWCHDLYCYGLLAIGQLEPARRHVEAALTRIRDRANLFHWCSVAREAAGDRVGAAEAAREALSLEPSHSPYFDQLQKFVTIPVLN